MCVQQQSLLARLFWPALASPWCGRRLERAEFEGVRRSPAGGGGGIVLIHRQSSPSTRCTLTLDQNGDRFASAPPRRAGTAGPPAPRAEWAPNWRGTLGSTSPARQRGAPSIIHWGRPCRDGSAWGERSARPPHLATRTACAHMSVGEGACPRGSSGGVGQRVGRVLSLVMRGRLWAPSLHAAAASSRHPSVWDAGASGGRGSGMLPQCRRGTLRLIAPAHAPCGGGSEGALAQALCTGAIHHVFSRFCLELPRTSTLRRSAVLIALFRSAVLVALRRSAETSASLFYINQLPQPLHIVTFLIYFRGHNTSVSPEAWLSYNNLLQQILFGACAPRKQPRTLTPRADDSELVGRPRLPRVSGRPPAPHDISTSLHLASAHDGSEVQRAKRASTGARRLRGRSWSGNSFVLGVCVSSGAAGRRDDRARRCSA